MAKLPEVVKEAIDKSTTACVATADGNAVSNVVYVSYLKYQNDDTIVIADNKFVKTRENLESNPQIAFVVLDADTNKAYQVKGKIQIYTEGKNYQSVVEWVHKKKPELTPKSAIYMQVEEVYCGSELMS